MGKGILIFISSGEQFDLGLLTYLCKLSKVYGYKVLFVDYTGKTLRGELYLEEVEGSCNTEVYVPSTIRSLHVLKEFLMPKKTNVKCVILPIGIGKAISVLTMVLTLIGKRVIRLIKRAKYPKYILWYSPSPIYIVKVPYMLRVSPDLPTIIGVTVKALLNLLASIMLALFSDYVLVRDPITYRVLKLFNPKTYFLLPQIAPLERREKDCNDNEARILAIVIVNRQGTASVYEVRYLKLLKVLAKIVPELSFEVVGTSRDEAIKILKDMPHNMSFKGLVYGKEFYSLLKKALAVFAYIEVPGNSNRVAEAIAYGKPVMISALTNQYHPGLQTCSVIIVPSYKGLSEVREKLVDNCYMLKLKKKVAALNKAYCRINERTLKGLIQNVFGNRKNLNNV